ncbi:MAG: hypothetical protein KDA25_03390 [Phycisphaerales bacterium]|nr:hypothetical protein [Phycisphaerales bacterium]
MGAVALPLIGEALIALAEAVVFVGSAAIAAVGLSEGINAMSEQADEAEKKAKTIPNTEVATCEACGGGGDGDGDDGDEKPELEHNPKHHQNARGKASQEPADAADVYKDAIKGKDGNWYGKNQNGDVYRYSRPSNGKTHWNGSTSGPNAIPKHRIPNNVKKSLGVPPK